MSNLAINMAGGGLQSRILGERWIGSARLAVVGVMVTWLPLLVLSLISGLTAGDKVALPFLKDPLPYARFLVALPLLLMAERTIRERLTDSVNYFWDSSILVEKDRDVFKAATDQANQRLDSVLMSVLFLLAAFTLSWFLRKANLMDGFSTWTAYGSEGDEQMTLAGWWYSFVSLPLFQSLLFQWAWRLIIWWRFLWRLSHFDLQLLPTHPDRTGGLGILGGGQQSFLLIVLATSALLSASLAELILREGYSVSSTAPAIGVYVVLSLLFIVAPLFMFSSKLIQARRRGLVEYGDLADDLFRAFDAKWINKSDAGQRQLLGSADPSSIADYGYAYEVVTEMRVIPYGRRRLVNAIILALIPFAPLLLMEHSLKEVLKMLAGILG